MRLQTKFALYNILSKLIIITGFGFTLTPLVKQIYYHRIDDRLIAKEEKILKIIQKNGLNEIFLVEEDSSYGNYNLLKEEFISVEPSKTKESETKIENTRRNIEDEILDYRVLTHYFEYENKIYLLEIGEGLSSIELRIITIRKLIIWMIIVTILLTTAIDIGYTNYLLRPLKTIIQSKLKKTNLPDQYNFKRIITSTDDFEYLDESINEMMKKIQETFQREKEFISNVSHELLTPISILQNRFENIVSEEASQKEVTIKIVESQKTLTRLSKIVKALLLISRIENNQYLKTDKVNLREVIEDVLTEIEDRLEHKKISLEKHMKNEYFFQCNRSLLFTLFFNLINNAIKYNKVNGKIIIEDFYENEKYIITINDTGIGIPSEQFSNIFNRFKRLHENDMEGYGLGLPIVKTIASFHHIDINIKSIINEGTTFKLIFL